MPKTIKLNKEQQKTANTEKCPSKITKKIKGAEKTKFSGTS
ncbi:MAG: hypothetical protein U9O94_03445 [Nanoarchaeota archaeon]|nr:hypothetical protein [Nanoarchaeota archaeon]